MTDKQDKVLELLAKGYPLQTVLNTLARNMESEHEGLLCSILLLDYEGKRLIHGAAPSLPEQYCLAVNGLAIGPEQGSCGSAAWHGRLVVSSDIEQDPLWAKFKHLALAYELKACWSQPIFAANGRILGTFALYYNDKREPQAHELRSIERAAAIAGIAISQRATEIALRYRFNFEKLIFSISTRFISASSEQIDEEALLALKSIGEFTDVDRSYIFVADRARGTVSNSHEWCKAGVKSERRRRQDIPIARFVWLYSKLQNKEPIYVRSPDDLPHDALNEREELKRRGIKSLIVVPMIKGDKVFGFVGLDTISAHKTWSADAVVLLKMFAQIFVSAFERKLHEAELRYSREQAVQHEAQLRLTFHNAQVGMATCTLDGRLLSVNNSLAKMLGRDSRELLRHTFLDLSHPEDSKIPRRKLVDLLRGRVNHIELEKRYIHKDGSIIYARKRIGAVFDAKHKPLYLVTEIEDITEKKKWESEYLRTSKLESLGVLAGGIAHDFNNILTAVLGGISHLGLELSGSPQADRLKDIEKAVYRAKDLTQQLLTFAKGGAPITKTANIFELLRDTLNFTLAGSEVSYELEPVEDLWPAEVDEGQISQVINNIVLNAVQAMPNGGRLRVSCRNEHVLEFSEGLGQHLPAGPYLKLSIKDQGEGIPSEILSKIFDPFFTTKASGTGLGLATTYSIIKKHRGRIEVESKLAQGTTVTIYLPATPEARISSTTNDNAIIYGRGRILLMDDEDIVRNSAGHMLNFLGYEVDYARDGSEAIESFQRAKTEGSPFDLLIMDLTIPGGMGGKTAISKIKEIDPKVKAIVSSGYTDSAIMSDFRKYGFVGVMTKPYEIGTLSKLLHECCG